MRLAIPGIALAALLSACGGDPAPTESCEDGLGLALPTGCAGVTRPRLCEETFCTGELPACGQQLHVLSGAAAGGDGTSAHPLPELRLAAQLAKDGDCILLGAGDYEGAELRGGVSLLGAGAARTRLKLPSGGDRVLAVKGGGGGLVRGVELGGAGLGLVISGVSALRVEQVRINEVSGVGLYAAAGTLSVAHTTVRGTRQATLGGSPTAMGVVLAPGSAATVQASLLLASAQLGLLAADSTLTLTGSALVENGSDALAASGGAALTCATSCQAASATLTDVLLRGSRGVGLLAAGLKLEADRLEVRETALAAGRARGLSLQAAAKFTLRHAVVADGKGQGAVVDGASGSLIASAVSGNLDRGLWLQSPAGAVSALQCEVKGNVLVGIGGLQASGVQVLGGTITGTRKAPTIVSGNTIEMGDGLQILAGSSFTVDGVSFAQNERLSVLVDGGTGSVKQSTFAAGVPALVRQGGGTVTALNNLDASGKGVGITDPATPYGMDPQPVWMPPPAALPGGI